MQTKKPEWEPRPTKRMMSLAVKAFTQLPRKFAYLYLPANISIEYWISMTSHISVGKAIWIGLLVVNGPVFLLMFGPPATFVYLQDHGFITKSHDWIGMVLFLCGVAVAWLWWSLSIPKWRLWAYERVVDIAQLKRSAVNAGLTWPDGSIFSKTEIKSSAHALREQELEVQRNANKPE